jgi:hypothetical protein
MLSGNGYGDEDREASLKGARDVGMTIVEPEGDELTLDLDCESAVDQCRRMLPMVHREYGVISVRAWASKSGPPHYHAVVEIGGGISDEERCALQVILGSDPVREFRNLVRVTSGVSRPIVLFAPAGAREEPIFSATMLKIRLDACR